MALVSRDGERGKPQINSRGGERGQQAADRKRLLTNRAGPRAAVRVFAGQHRLTEAAGRSGTYSG